MADEKDVASNVEEIILSRKDIEGFGDVMLELSAVLGKAYMPIEQFLKLGRGAIIELDKNKEDDLNICVNGSYVADGEITVNDEFIGVIVTNIVK